MIEVNTEMFCVTDVINQYNYIDKINKQLYKFLEIKQTQEMLDI